MPPASSSSALASRHQCEILLQVSKTIRKLVNPIDYFSGAKLEDALLAGNIVVFKRTSTETLKPRGVTHNYHHRFELVIPLVKAGRIHVDGTAYLLSPGQVFLIFPRQFHHYLDVKGGGINWLFITCEFSRPQALLPLRNSPRVLSAPEAKHLHSTMKEYLQKPPGPERNFALIVNVSLLIQRLFAAREADCVIRSDGRQNDPRGTILQSINAYVRSNLHQPLTIKDVSEHTGYSISHLRAVFRREFGVSLGGYMRDSRLFVAASMLAGADRSSIASIAKACGFVSIFAFSRAFKKAMGHSPRAYHRFVNCGALGGAAAMVQFEKL
jgi:AraC-like DNA-binding protein